MRIRSALIASLLSTALPSIAHAQQVKVVASCPTGVSPVYDVGSPGGGLMIDTSGNLCVGQSGQLPPSATQLTGNGSGSTGAVVGTLAAAVGKTTYICGFNVSAIGGTAAVGPITIAGLIGSSMVYQLTSSATGVTLPVIFTPCIPASATNTAITVTTTADGTATAVNVNSWGFRQ